MKNLIKIILLLSWLPAMAKGAGSPNALRIEAASASFNQQGASTAFTGGVKLTEGNFFLSAQTLEAKELARGDYLIRASGQPVSFKSTGDKAFSGSASMVTYRTKDGILTLKGEALIQQGADTLRGESITYDKKSGRYSINGGKLPAVVVLHAKEGAQ